MKYTISISDVAEYEVEADTLEQAKLQALTWWDERTPYMLVRDENGYLARNIKKRV